MNRICTDMIQRLAEGNPLTREMEKHIEICPDCAFFRKLQDDVPVESSPENIPPELDAVIHSAACRHAAIRKWKVWKIALPVAASFAVCFGLVFYSFQPKQDSAVPSGLVIQNGTSWNSDFDENLIALSCDVAGGASVITNLYDSI